MYNPKLRTALLGGLILAFCTSASFADQTFKRKENGKIAFKVSEQNVTRLRFKNDRVVEIITDESSFEHKNDETSGDIFFRKIEGADASVERGFLITEKGVTISYQMTPVKKPVADIVVEVTGLEQKTRSASVTSRAVLGTAGRGIPAASGYKGGLINVMREVILKDLPAKKGGKSGVRKRLKRGSYHIDVHVIKGGKTGKTISEANFARANVVAIWVETPVLTPGQSGWLVVVRK